MSLAPVADPTQVSDQGRGRARLVGAAWQWMSVQSSSRLAFQPPSRAALAARTALHRCHQERWHRTVVLGKSFAIVSCVKFVCGDVVAERHVICSLRTERIVEFCKILDARHPF